MRAIIHIMLRQGVLDAQGKAIENALDHLGFTGVNQVRQGKIIELTLDQKDAELARQQVAQMCDKLLVNNVIEHYDFTLSE